MNQKNIKMETLIHTDQKKYQILIQERESFASQLNSGLDYLKDLPFVSEASEPDYTDPIGWWHSEILLTIKPKRIKGLKPSPSQLAKGYEVNYDEIIREINSFPWSAADMLAIEDGRFSVSDTIRDQVKESCSVYADEVTAEVFKKQAKMLDLLNQYCKEHNVFRPDMEKIAMSLFCKTEYVQGEKQLRIIPDHRILLRRMKVGTTNG